RHAVRIGDAIAPAAGRSGDAVGIQSGREARGGVSIEPLDVDAKRALQGDVLAKRLDARRAREEKQIAVLMEVDRLADFVGEALEESDRLDRQPDVGGVRKLMADAAGVTTRGTGRE